MTAVQVDGASLLVGRDVDAREAARLRELATYAVLDTAPDPAFDEITALTARLCSVPVALVNLVDAERLWSKSAVGLPRVDIPRGASFCTHALTSTAVMEVPDARLDPRFADNAAVTGPPWFRFYAGAPLVGRGGHVLGTLCVLDHRVRTLTDTERGDLQLLARQVVHLLQVHRRTTELSATVQAGLTAARDQLQVVEGVLGQADVLVCVKGLDGEYLYANPALDALVQVPGGLLGRRDDEVFPPEQAQAYRLHDLAVARGAGPQVVVEQLTTPDGVLRTYSSTKFPLRDADGRVTGVAGVITEVTGEVTPVVTGEVTAG